MRLIDADALQFHDVDFMYLPPILMVSKHDIDAAPTVDAVAVVRCRDCVFVDKIPENKAQLIAEGCLACSLGRGDDIYGISAVWPDEYCSEGERKEAAHE